MMETFQLTEKELAEMKQFYKDEFNRTKSRLLHIRAVLKRLGVAVTENDIEEIPGITTAPEFKAGVKLGAGRSRKRTGRKSKWELLIMKRMRQLNRPVTYEELTDEIMAFSKFPDIKRTSTKQAVVNVVFRLRTRDKKLDTFSVGTREKYIGLKGWFDANGLIKKEYSARINGGNPVKKEKKRKVGRPRKKNQA